MPRKRPSIIPKSNRKRDLTMVSKLNMKSYFDQEDNEINGNFT